MWHLLQRHPIPIAAHFEFSLVLTYAYPRALLEPLLPPGLELDCYEDLGFLAIALVATRELRPVGLPRWMGKRFFLSGYRVFTRFTTREGRRLRGLRILRSDTDARLMAFFGNLLTHYQYEHATVRWERGADFQSAAACRTNRPADVLLTVAIRTPAGAADLEVSADLRSRPAPLPPGSPFPDERTARRFAGPLPFTFDYEPETHSIIRIEGVRQNWHPEPIAVEVRRASFLERPPFDRAEPRLANAFYLEDVPYRWNRGIREPLGR